MIDNYDSFTYNLAQYFAELGVKVTVYRNDQIHIDDIAALNPDWIVISPGPCTPKEAGISNNVIQQFAGHVPMLGVCLGHQCMAQTYGGSIVRAQSVMHGKVSSIYHNNKSVFKDLPNPFTATRYHSLIIENKTLPVEFEITAWTQQADGQIHEIMGIRHRDLPLEGVQFHPESILTEHGHRLLKCFLLNKKTSTGTLVSEPARFTVEMCRTY